MANAVCIVVKDNLGQTFDPASLPHSYEYDANGNLLQDQCIEQSAIIRQKTYTYVEVGTAWLVASESAWVVQDSEG